MNFLCISFYFKGAAFLEACHAAGNKVFLLTKKSLENHPWPKEILDHVFYMESDLNTPQNHQDMADGLAWFLKENKIDRIVALDDFDVEKAAFLREEFRIPGMGQTTARYFRDKLAMRVQAADKGVPVPPFSAIFNNEMVNHFADTVAPPWVVKPRGEASATGIKKVSTKDELWEVVNNLGEERRHFLVEQFLPGDVYHVDALSADGKLVFCKGSKYLNTPFEVAHGGGVFRSQTLDYKGDEEKELKKLTQIVMDAFGMKYSASHTEFIKSHATGQFYFLETASRVGGAHLAEMVEFATGINLWTEWANLETAVAKGEKYTFPKSRKEHAGILISLAKMEHPNTKSFKDEEIVWRIQKPYHIGFILQSKNQKTISQLLDDYVTRVFKDYHASAPSPDKSLD